MFGNRKPRPAAMQMVATPGSQTQKRKANKREHMKNKPILNGGKNARKARAAARRKAK